MWYIIFFENRNTILNYRNLKLMSQKISVVVWNENLHEKSNEIVKSVYPDGIHNAIANLLSKDDIFEISTATLDEENHGLSDEVLAKTNVLLWWGHAAHGKVADEIVEKVAEQVWAGMGLIVLHSGHFAKIFKRLMGTPCNLKWREAGEKERIWVASPNHPIAAGIPEQFELENEEMYSEPFGIPQPLDTVFISWYQGGEVFRSGVTFKRGAGNIFYFSPGHETYPTYHNDTIGQILINAVNWANNPQEKLKKVTDAPNVPVDQALEKIAERGPKLHAAGEEGFK